MRKIKKLRKGFTLVELVVVIAVIAILAGVSVGAYFGITDSANSSNASVAQKQVKDYWTMYSIEEYNPNHSLGETGDDFAIRYLTEYQGYTSTYVNYAKVTYKTPGSGLANDDTKDALLLKIESNYPSYLLVKGDRIIESSAAAKSEEEFLNLITSSELIVESGSEVEFELSTIQYNDGTETKEVRGHRYIKFDVEIKKGSKTTGTDVVFVKNGSSISSTDGSYTPSYFKTAEGVDEKAFKLLNDTEEIIHDEIIISDDFGAYKALFEVRMDYSRSLRCLVSYIDSPCAALFYSYSEVCTEVKERICTLNKSDDS